MKPSGLRRGAAHVEQRSGKQGAHTSPCECPESHLQYLTAVMATFYTVGEAASTGHEDEVISSNMYTFCSMGQCRLDATSEDVAEGRAIPPIGESNNMACPSSCLSWKIQRKLKPRLLPYRRLHQRCKRYAWHAQSGPAKHSLQSYRVVLARESPRFATLSRAVLIDHRRCRGGGARSIHINPLASRWSHRSQKKSSVSSGPHGQTAMPYPM